MSVQFWVNRALVARWIDTTVAAGVVALLVHVSDTDEPGDLGRQPARCGRYGPGPRGGGGWTRRLTMASCRRNIVGEGGERIHDALCKIVRTKDDLTQQNFKEVLKQAGYRWVDSGSGVMTAVVAYFRDDLQWDWQGYLQQAEQAKEWNFPDDPLLKIKTSNSRCATWRSQISITTMQHSICMSRGLSHESGWWRMAGS